MASEDIRSSKGLETQRTCACHSLICAASGKARSGFESSAYDSGCVVPDNPVVNTSSGSVGTETPLL